MARRLLAAGLVCVIIGIPLAGDVCEVICAEHAGQSAGSTSATPQHQHHSATAAEPSHHHYLHSELAVPRWRATPAPMPHECRRLEAAATVSREIIRAPVVKAIVTMTLANQALVRVLSPSETNSRHGPSTPVHSTSPLRI